MGYRKKITSIRELKAKVGDAKGIVPAEGDWNLTPKSYRKYITSIKELKVKSGGVKGIFPAEEDWNLTPNKLL